MGLKSDRKCQACGKTVYKGTTKDYFKVIDNFVYHTKCVESDVLHKAEKCSGCGKAIDAGTHITDFEVIDDKFFHSGCVNIEQIEPEEHTDEGPIAKPTEPVINVGTADSTANNVDFIGGWYSQTIVSKKIKPSPDWQYRLDSAGREHCRFVGKNRTLTKSECDNESHDYCPGCPENLTCHARPFPTHSAWRAWAHAEIGTNRDPDQRERFMQPDWADTEKYGPLGVKAKPKPIEKGGEHAYGGWGGNISAGGTSHPPATASYLPFLVVFFTTVLSTKSKRSSLLVIA